MRDYELTFIVHPQVGSDEFTTIIEDVKTLIESRDGTVKKVEPWGSRRLAYPIKRVWEGQYVHMEIGLEPQTIVEIEQRLKLNESIIRHLIVRVED